MTNDQRPTATVIRNPASRRQIAPAQLEAALDTARRAGWQLDVRVTDAAGHATEIAREAAASGVHIVLVNGGDGTINEAVNGLAGSATALAVLPGGTANVWAKEIGVSRKPALAMQAMVTGERRRVDLGRANGRYFLLMAGIGLDAKIVASIGPRLKRRLGAAAYVLIGAREAIRTKPWRVQLRIDGAETDTQLYWGLVGNTRLYGGVAHITRWARADDALLDAVMMHRGGLHLLVDAPRVFLRRHRNSPNIDYVKSTSLHVASPGLPVQLDGEPYSTTPMTFDIAPDALEVVVPTGLRSPLFVSASDSR